ncbi:MAG: hypothetical protein BWY15_00264 [Firmicutes bacterium ADurb.Bin193]|nr:MAG: hypothetical protein BWY15_00264 [Firmicutes bacterium ADurb.Bin193]
MFKTINASKESGDEGGLKLVNIAKSIALCYAVTILLLSVFSVLVTYLAFPEEFVPVVVLLITIVGVIFSGFLVTRTAKIKGWLFGSISGIVYVVTLYIIGSMLTGDFSFGMSFLTMLLVGALSGAFGGIIGVNTKR